MWRERVLLRMDRDGPNAEPDRRVQRVDGDLTPVSDRGVVKPSLRLAGHVIDTQSCMEATVARSFEPSVRDRQVSGIGDDF